MASEFGSAQLILKLYELRREPVLRQARAWFVNEFNPATFEELAATVTGEKSAWFRMVLGYSDMAASLVTSGAIDAAMFRASSGEMLPTFAKVEPFLDKFRGEGGDYLKHVEAVVRDMPGSKEYIAMLRERMQPAAQQQAARA